MKQLSYKTTSQSMGCCIQKICTNHKIKTR